MQNLCTTDLSGIMGSVPEAGMDATVVVDAAMDATTPPMDARPMDATQPPMDATQPPMDATQPPIDASEPPMDAAEPPMDAEPDLDAEP